MPRSLNNVSALPRSDFCAVSPSKPPLESVAQLTMRLAANDEAAFRAFHAAYFDRLYHFLLVVTHGDTHAARDALQETVVRIARHIRRFDDEEVFWCWLKAVARTAAQDDSRKRRRYLALLTRFGFSPVDRANDPSETADDLRAIATECVGELNPRDQALITGKYFQGATVAEIASDTGLTEKAIESRLVRLRRALADAILKKLRQP